MEKETAAYKEIRQFVQRNEAKIYIETDRKENAVSSSILLTNILRWLITDSKAMAENEHS